MAEWLGRGLQNLVHRFDSGSRLHALGLYLHFKPRDVWGLLCYAHNMQLPFLPSIKAKD